MVAICHSWIAGDVSSLCAFLKVFNIKHAYCLYKEKIFMFKIREEGRVIAMNQKYIQVLVI